MPINNIVQPLFIEVDESIRLRRFDGQYQFALSWYQDSELVWLVDGIKAPYTMQKLTDMYHYLNNHGELYFIEKLIADQYRPIGDVTLNRQNIPIVIGDKTMRRRGIAQRVIKRLLSRAQQLGYKELCIAEIYDWNLPSQKCFQKLGFKPYKKTEKGSSYKLVF